MTFFPRKFLTLGAAIGGIVVSAALAGCATEKPATPPAPAAEPAPAPSANYQWSETQQSQQ